MERSFARSVGSLPEIFSFVAGRLAAEGVDREEGFWVDLVVEELFTNMVKHAASGASCIAVALYKEGDRLVVRLKDFDVDPFDPTRAPDVDTGGSLQERRLGGLGLHFVKQLAERFGYDYHDRTSTITVTRRLEGRDV